MRLLIFFDLPQITKHDHYEYSKFIKNLKKLGFMRMQYSIYSRLCIDAAVAKRISTNLKYIAPQKGDIRYLIITEKQYQTIADINNSYSFQEKIINKNRLIIIGGLDDNY